MERLTQRAPVSFGRREPVAQPPSHVNQVCRFYEAAFFIHRRSQSAARRADNYGPSTGARAALVVDGHWGGGVDKAKAPLQETTSRATSQEDSVPRCRPRRRGPPAQWCYRAAAAVRGSALPLRVLAADVTVFGRRSEECPTKKRRPTLAMHQRQRSIAMRASYDARWQQMASPPRRCWDQMSVQRGRRVGVPWNATLLKCSPLAAALSLPDGGVTAPLLA